MKQRTFTNKLLCGFLLVGAVSLATPFQAFAEPSTTETSPSQKIKVTGVVEDAEGPVIGASVMEKGTNNGTVTDLDGNFTLMVSPGATLKISYVGSEPIEVKATEAPMKITLEQSTQMLSEVVVTALGIKRDRKALGYGLDDAFEKAKETNVINSMAGRVAGLVVSQTAGGPSGSTRVILRGSTEMTGNNQPLYVVDGVPLDNTNFGSAGTSIRSW